MRARDNRFEFARVHYNSPITGGERDNKYKPGLSRHGMAWRERIPPRATQNRERASEKFASSRAKWVLAHWPREREITRVGQKYPNYSDVEGEKWPSFAYLRSL